MSFLDQLGLGGVFGVGNYSPDYLQLGQQQYIPQSSPICIHSNCSICKERYDNQVKLWQEQEELKKKKKEDYKKRCIEYMDKFRDKI